MNKTSTIYFKDNKGAISSAELSEAWMASNRANLDLFIIATPAKGKGEATSSISIPAAVVELIPQAKLNSFKSKMEDLGKKYNAKPAGPQLFMINNIPVKEEKKEIAEILDSLEGFRKKT